MIVFNLIFPFEVALVNKLSDITSGIENIIGVAFRHIDDGIIYSGVLDTEFVLPSVCRSSNVVDMVSSCEVTIGICSLIGLCLWVQGTAIWDRYVVDSFGMQVNLINFRFFNFFFPWKRDHFDPIAILVGVTTVRRLNRRFEAF